jgi:alpha-ketoglutarate-dependent sulfate ester dioxygenase
VTSQNGSTSTEAADIEMQVEPLTMRTGAIIHGVDLSTKLDDDVIAKIRSALLRHRVVFFRDQHIEAAHQLAFASRFGEITAGHPTLRGEAGQPAILELDSLEGGRAAAWHTDNTFTDRPPAFSVLRSVVIPPCGGDTMWASTVAAYEHLPEPLRLFADQLRVVHTNADDAASAVTYTDEATRLHDEEFVSTIFETEHPMVRVHSETGERSLMLGGFAQRIVGLGGGDSRKVINLLQDWVPTPENIVRWHWRQGDVAMWDNRATQHYAVNDYGNIHRLVKRVTVAGSVPVGIDGRPSVALRGDASAYSIIGAR